MKKIGKNNITILLLLVLFLKNGLIAQIPITEQEAIDLALKNNPPLQRNQSRIEQTKALLPTAKTLPNAEFSMETPQFLMAPDNSPIWTTLGVQQTFLSPKVYRQNEKVLQQQVKVAQSEQLATVHDIRFKARQLYQNCLFTKEKIRFAQEQDSIFKEMNHVAEVEYKVGKITPLEKQVMVSFYANIVHILRGGQMEFQNALSELSQYLKTPQVSVNQYFTRLVLKNTAQKQVRDSSFLSISTTLLTTHPRPLKNAFTQSKQAVRAIQKPLKPR